MSKNIIVIYKSKTGFTERFAHWIGEELQCDIIPYTQRNTVNLEQYDTIIYGGGVYAGGIDGLKWLKEKLPALACKKVVIFASGASPSDSPEVPKSMRQNFTNDEWEKVKTFYFQGGLCYEKMGLLSKLMMSMFRSMLKKQADSSEMYQAIASSYDVSSKDAVMPLVSYCLK